MARYLITFNLHKPLFEQSIDPRYYIDTLKEMGTVEIDIIQENIPNVEDTITDEHVFEAKVILESEHSLRDVEDALHNLLEYGVNIEVEKPAESMKEETKDEVPERLLESYFAESRDIVTRLYKKLDTLMQEPENSSFINEIFREFHTLKGGTGILLSYGVDSKLEMLKNLTQSAEGLLHRARDEKLIISKEQLALIQSSVDRIDDLLEAYEQVVDLDYSDVEELLDNYGSLGIEVENRSHQEQSKALNTKLAAINELSKQYLPLFEEISKKSKLDDAEIGFVRQSINVLSKFKANMPQELVVNIESISSVVKEKQFDQIVEPLSLLVTQLKEIATPKTKKVEIKEKVKKHSAQHATTLRVNEKIIDDLMSLVGEITVFKEWFSFFITKLSRKYQQKDAAKELKNQFQRFNDIVETMQDIVLDMRMVPLSTIFDRYPKLVRDLSRNLGKKIQYSEDGADTLLDKMVIEKIGEPMVHLIRNAIDHGIEQPSQRRESGKDETGTLKIQAFQKSGKVYIRVEDDGAGIDAQKLKPIALSKGLVTEEKCS